MKRRMRFLDPNRKDRWPETSNKLPEVRCLRVVVSPGEFTDNFCYSYKSRNNNNNTVKILDCFTFTCCWPLSWLLISFFILEKTDAEQSNYLLKLINNYFYSYIYICVCVTAIVDHIVFSFKMFFKEQWEK